MSGAFTSERELAAAVVAWLRDLRWEVYQEVPVGCGVADIVAKQRAVTWLIETKLSMSIQLLKQLDDRVGHAHMTSAAVPVGARRAVPYKVFKALGAGLITVWPGGIVNERLRPQFFRRVAGVELHEEQKTFCNAGSSSGGHWTPFRQTARNVQAYVSHNPGCSMSQLLAGIKHHYRKESVANSSIVAWIEDGVIKGVRVDRSQRPMKLYPVEEVRA